MLNYDDVKTLHASLPPFSPIVPTQSLPSLAFILLSTTFALGFYFTTLPKSTIPAAELSVAALASIFAGFGVVALFCSAGVYL
ncbi:hypothetical protein FRC03_009357 [Tulasnella sp. 419]|nr:hypothetical protein FRC02_007123 [Tulasnella sp. 418]KAG8958210.1 hypothetical protein FRC03_009357 [Tulasnella sp. 419]